MTPIQPYIPQEGYCTLLVLSMVLFNLSLTHTFNRVSQFNTYEKRYTRSQELSQLRLYSLTFNLQGSL